MTLDHELGGVADEETGRLGRNVLEPFYLHVPSEVRIVDGMLRWRNSDFVTQVDGLLADFVGLGQETTRESNVMSFAKKWGAIELCEEHRYPAGHDSLAWIST